MADKHIADGESTFKSVCSAPDACLVGKDVIPFDSFQELSKQKQYAQKVNARGQHVLTVGSVIAGTQSNAGNGVVSGTSGEGGDCIVLTGADNVNAHGQPIARHLSDVAMNNGNTAGKLYTQASPATGEIKENRHPCNDPPKRSPDLDKLEQLKTDLQNNTFNAHNLDQYVRFGETSQITQGWVDSIQAGQDSWAVTKGASGVTRGALGFLKDAVLGIGQLAYVGAKRLSPVTRLEDQVDSLILAENIRLGNVCLEQLEQQAKAIGKELAKPVTDAWAKGEHAEAITRGGLELAIILLPIAKAGVAGKAGSSARAAEAARAAEVSKGGAAAEVAQTTKATEVKSRPVDSNGVKVKKHPLRAEYEAKVKALKDKEAKLRAEGKSDEEIARSLHAERRSLGVEYKELTPADKLEEVYARNLEKYGDKLGPSIGWLRARGKTWEQIIESASRPGGADLGL